MYLSTTAARLSQSHRKGATNRQFSIPPRVVEHPIRGNLRIKFGDIDFARRFGISTGEREQAWEGRMWWVSRNISAKRRRIELINFLIPPSFFIKVSGRLSSSQRSLLAQTAAMRTTPAPTQGCLTTRPIPAGFLNAAGRFSVRNPD